MTDGTVHSNRPHTVMLDKTIKQAHSVDAAIRNSHNLYSTLTERLQQYTDWKEQLTRIQQLKTAHTVPLVLSTDGIISNNNTNWPYSTTSTVHRRYYLKQQYKLPVQYHQYCPQRVLSQTTIQTAHTVPPVLSTDGIISNNNTNFPYSTTSTTHTVLSQTTTQTSHTVPPALPTHSTIPNNNTNFPYSTTSTTHTQYYPRQQHKPPIQYHQHYTHTVLSPLYIF